MRASPITGWCIALSMLFSTSKSPHIPYFSVLHVWSPVRTRKRTCHDARAFSITALLETQRPMSMSYLRFLRLDVRSDVEADVERLA